MLTGRLDHEELAELLPACEALVVPSTFPEAFGMVAAEAAACGALPISAAHSGLAEVSDALAGRCPGGPRGGCRSRSTTAPCGRSRSASSAGSAADAALRAQTRAGLVATVARALVVGGRRRRRDRRRPRRAGRSAEP